MSDSASDHDPQEMDERRPCCHALLAALADIAQPIVPIPRDIMAMAAIEAFGDAPLARCQQLVGPGSKAPRWWHCDTHGPGSLTAWGCPECVREMRLQLAERSALPKLTHEQACALHTMLDHYGRDPRMHCLVELLPENMRRDFGA
ncbi:MAG: hypothetical protein JNL87_09320 [Burkholderiaceae bacterium]|nr:hypothetical protein [Burkholderiaceae bacterium]